MADRRRVVEGTHHAFVLRSASGWRRTGRDITRSRKTGVVDAAAIANCRLRDRRPCFHSAFRTMYSELHCHSAFSFLDGASLPEQLALAASQLVYPALALTDHHGLYGSM